MNDGAILTVRDLTDGINAFKAKPGWDQDLHARLYVDLRDALSGGVTGHWWALTVDRLTSWRALRPHTKDEIREEGRKALPALRAAYEAIMLRHADRMPDLASVHWGEVSVLFETAHGIKNSVHRRKLGQDLTSHVFASKLCHFMLPGVFLVVDNEMMGGTSDYGSLWLECRRAWCASEGVHDELRSTLGREIGGEDLPVYPWAAKICELCIMGRYARQSR